MGKGIIIGLVILILVVAIFGFYFYNQDNYNESKEITLGLADSFSYLKECQAVEGQDRANLSERLRMCPSLPNQETFDKLESVKDYKGILECESERTSECNGLIDGCELLTNFSYDISATSGGHVPYSEGIGIYKCSRDHYLSESFGPPPKMKVFRIQLDKETANKLKD